MTPRADAYGRANDQVFPLQCMCLYWTASSLYGLVQNLALKRPPVRQLFGLSASPVATTGGFGTRLDKNLVEKSKER